ncbi:MAG: BrnT family toxin [Candidatus Competibacteraceae bacterium]
MQYHWDPTKAEANLRAHGVSFVEAVTVLEDEFALTREDPDSEGEQRFVTLGMSGTGSLLVVVYTYREPDVIRLISAWKANKRQRLVYERNRR